MKRSGKFYRINEATVMKELGLKPTKNSGSGWVEKEDGQDENLICQLKSTDANSIKVNKQDLDTLAYNANVAHKIPIFAIQFLQSNETYLIVKPEMLEVLAKYLKTDIIENDKYNDLIDLSDTVKSKTADKKVVKSGINARNAFVEEQNKKYKKRGKSAI